MRQKYKPKRWAFSKAAATRSLSANCLLTASSLAWVPGAIVTSTLNLGGKDLKSLTRIDKPIIVAMLQCGIVGVKATWKVGKFQNVSFINVFLPKLNIKLSTKLNLTVKRTYVLNFYPPKSWFRKLILYLELKSNNQNLIFAVIFM